MTLCLVTGHQCCCQPDEGMACPELGTEEERVRDGSKRYEVRRFDRDFHVGDILILVEFDRETARYSGESVRAKVTTITEPGAYGLPADVGVLGIEVLA